MAVEARRDPERSKGAIRRIAEELGVHPEALRTWVKKAEIDAGARPGTTTSDAERIRRLEKEVRELRRANAILRSASAFFAAGARTARPADLRVHRLPHREEFGACADLPGAGQRRCQDRPEHHLRSQDPAPQCQGGARPGSEGRNQQSS